MDFCGDSVPGRTNYKCQVSEMRTYLMSMRNSKGACVARAELKQAGTWDPLLQCCNACNWTNSSWSYKI